jgi:lipopolysaccharide/colanic/teichoic acid biosynthesis glycosyltransferase
VTTAELRALDIDDLEESSEEHTPANDNPIMLRLGHTFKDLITPSPILSTEIKNVFPTYQEAWYKEVAWLEEARFQSSSALAIYIQFKRVFDILLVIVTAPITIPVMGLISLLIYLEDGKPITFRQKRTGMGGRQFELYKFRSMVPNAEALLRELADQGLAKLDSNGKLAEPLKLDRDPRVTRLGRILRKTSLDELPQLINVLKGNMSLVGPRPTSWDLESYQLFHTERLSVRPGITGLLQVYDRGSTDFNVWLKWDVKYVDKMSFYLDTRILFMTLAMILFKRKGAR